MLNKILAATIVMALTSPVLAQDSNDASPWVPIDDPDEIAALIIDQTFEADLPGRGRASATYRADGTGVLRAWNENFPRTWEIKPDGQFCVTTRSIAPGPVCYRLERNSADANTYRTTDPTTGRVQEFSIVDGVVTREPAAGNRDAGSATEPSADEIAKSLANPNTPLATLTTKLQYTRFTGDLPNADGQDGFTVLLQPAFPFPAGEGQTVFFRPAIPVIADQPVFNEATNSFTSEAGLGDIAFDLAYGVTTKSGWIAAAGIVSSLPTATDSGLGNGQWTLGPEVVIGKIGDGYVLGAFPSHQWDIAGTRSGQVNATSVQLFATAILEDGWTVGTSPTLKYDWVSDASTIPFNLGVTKTTIIGGRPWKFGAELNYFIKQPDQFGPEWLVTFNIAPVVENIFATMFD